MEANEPTGRLDGPALVVAETELLGRLVTTLVETRSAIASLQAFEVRALAAAVALAEEQTSRITAGDSRSRDIPLRSVAAEIGSALRISDRSIQRQLTDASSLVERFPQTLTAFASGEISRGHVSVIVESGHMIDDPAARSRFETAVLSRARAETPGRLRPIAKILAARIHPVSIDDRHREARAGRGVRVIDLEDGMAELLATLPAVLAHGIHDRLTQQAKSVKDARRSVGSGGEAGATAEGGSDAGDHGGRLGGADERTMDELRADILSDMLLTAVPAADAGGDRSGLGAIRATVHVTVPVLTLMGRGYEPACLMGNGPVDSETARVLAGGVPAWERVLTHPVTGAVLSIDRYRPNRDLRRLLQVRDAHCRFPGCRMPTWRCDVDHSVAAAQGGETTDRNLAHLCRRHHVLKHATPWSVIQRGGGLLEWTSPTGLVYVDRPEATLCFIEANEYVVDSSECSTGTSGVGPPGRGHDLMSDGDPPPF